jgi:hypothetical protein
LQGHCLVGARPEAFLLFLRAARLVSAKASGKSTTMLAVARQPERDSERNRAQRQQKRVSKRDMAKRLSSMARQTLLVLFQIMMHAARLMHQLDIS